MSPQYLNITISIQNMWYQYLISIADVIIVNQLRPLQSTDIYTNTTP
jgi:hypothetical protein